MVLRSYITNWCGFTPALGSGATRVEDKNAAAKDEIAREDLSQSLPYEGVEDHICRITFNRLHRLNAIVTPDMNVVLGQLLELAEHKIRVNAIASDYTETPGTRGNFTGPVDESKWYRPGPARPERPGLDCQPHAGGALPHRRGMPHAGGVPRLAHGDPCHGHRHAG